MGDNNSNNNSLFFLWVDLETDGTNPEDNQILEISCILTDNKLNQIGEPFNSLILPEGDYESLVNNMSPYVKTMHTENGLLVEIKKMLDEYYDNAYNIKSTDPKWKWACKVEKEILDWLNELLPKNQQQSLEITLEIRMAGHSINSLDKPFIKVYMPTLHGMLSHRTLDISSHVRFITDVCDISNDKIPFGIKKMGHRASDDNFNALEEARKLRVWIRKQFTE